MATKKYVILIDNGHGIETPGKRSPIWKDGSQLLEWKWTRELAQFVQLGFQNKGIESVILVPEEKDISLTERCRREHKYRSEHRDVDTIFLSLHGNAAGVEEAKGYEVFTSPGETDSDPVAHCVLKRAEESKAFKMRFNEGKAHQDKEERFTVLTNTQGKAILVESGFYTNEAECKFMQSLKGLNIISSIVVDGICDYIGRK